MSLQDSQIEEVTNRVVRRLEERLEISVEQIQHFTGPLPPPEICKQYQEIWPGFMDQAFGFSKKIQDDHNATIRRRDWMHFGFKLLSLFAAVVFCLLFGGVGLFLLERGSTLEGLLSLGVVLVGIIGAFIGKDPKEKKKNQER